MLRSRAIAYESEEVVMVEKYVRKQKSLCLVHLQLKTDAEQMREILPEAQNPQNEGKNRLLLGVTKRIQFTGWLQLVT